MRIPINKPPLVKKNEVDDEKWSSSILRSGSQKKKNAARISWHPLLVDENNSKASNQPSYASKMAKTLNNPSNKAKIMLSVMDMIKK